MTDTNDSVSRRRFLGTSLAAAGASLLPLDRLANAMTLPADVTARAPQRPARYTRYNVMSPGGQRALASYANGVAAMLALPADHPQNWFHNAFVHLMDCPHGNWWFYVWHRGYLGYFEQTIRTLSGDASFAIPYWDWTTLPRIPDAMFNGVLTPTDRAFEPYTRNLSVFTTTLRPALEKYWNGLSAAQRGQLNTRGYTSLDKLWNDVTGYDPSSQNGISGNMAYANTCGSRYLSRDNPRLDAKTTYDVSPAVIRGGLKPVLFYSPTGALSFTSTKTPSHNTQPSSTTVFSVLEGLPHNKVHNYIGGVGPVDPGPYGNMTNFLSPVDPIFFLHHSNMDRLWDVWTRKQQSIGQPWLPTGSDLATLAREPFLFFVNGSGQYVGPSVAGDYLNTARFDYSYEPGFGEEVVQPARPAPRAIAAVRGTVRGNSAAVTLPESAIASHLDATTESTLVAEVTLPHPTPDSPTREFDVLVGAPSGVTQVDADSPFFAGTIAFHGHMAHDHDMPTHATFAVPLPKRPAAFPDDNVVGTTRVNVRVVPAHGQAPVAPVLRSVVIRGS